MCTGIAIINIYVIHSYHHSKTVYHYEAKKTYIVKPRANTKQSEKQMGHWISSGRALKSHLH